VARISGYKQRPRNICGPLESWLCVGAMGIARLQDVELLGPGLFRRRMWLGYRRNEHTFCCAQKIEIRIEWAVTVRYRSF
jgi:hypothetical protein